jgi:hypothetical protein
MGGIAGQPETILNFVGLTLAGMKRLCWTFRLEFGEERLGPEEAASLAAFYFRYLDGFEAWSAEVKGRLVRAFALSEGDMSALVRAVDANAEECLRVFRNALVAEPKSLLLELMAKVLAVSLPGRGYDSRMRALLLDMRRRLRLGQDDFIQSVEWSVLHELRKSALQGQQELEAQQSKERTRRRWVFTGIGAVAGGLAVGLTAGLAAPFVFPALASAVGLTSLAAFFATTGGIATMSVLFGAAGAGLTSYRVGRRLGDVEDFRFIPLGVNPFEERLHAVVGVSGWLDDEADVWQPWAEAVHCSGSDVYALQWEKGVLLALGKGLHTLITGTAASLAATELLKLSLAASAVTMLMFPVALLQSGDLIDNPWSLGMVRARLAGRILADVIRRRVHGHRPVSLYGFSLGALVILSCLEELSNDAGDAGDDAAAASSDVFGAIDNVVLFGIPATVLPTHRWMRARCLVAGRLIHCFSRSDWVLSFLYRGASLEFDQIAGMSPLSAVPEVESVDFTGLVRGHLEYRQRLPELLELLSIF